MEITERICEACGRPFAAPGLGRTRRFCFTCSPSKLPGLQVCPHGEVGPCGSCFMVDAHQRRARRTGGRGLRVGPDALAVERERIADERRRLRRSDLSVKQRAEVRSLLRPITGSRCAICATSSGTTCESVRAGPPRAPVRAVSDVKPE